MITLAALTFLYFLPTIVASNRGHRVAGIFLFNLFFGWTGIVWIVLLLCGLLCPAHDPVYPAAYYPPNDWRG
jgi:hypothetical protein